MKFKVQIYFDKKIKPKVEGQINVKQDAQSFRFFDGWTIQNVDQNNNYKGYYNIIHWHSKESRLTAENDILGYRPLYIYWDSAKLIFSDNFWDVFDQANEIEIDYDAIEQLRNFRRLIPSYKTCIKNIYRLPAGGKLTLKKGDNSPQIEYLKNFKQNPDPAIDVNRAADQLHQSFLKVFESIKNRVGENEVWFGNSGGLDSRLIPAYSQHFGINIKGYIISNKKPKGLQNQSIKSARKISKYFGFDFVSFNYDEGDGWKRMLRDLYISPFGTSDFIKNPNYEMFQGKYILNGGNSFIIANDNNFWKDETVKRFPIRSFVEKYFVRNKEKKELISGYQALLEKQVREILGPNSDSFSIMRTLHQSFLNHTSSAGGFESMSMAGEVQTIHHPFVTEIAKKWPEHLFYDRKVQMALFINNFPKLLTIPDQNGLLRGDSSFSKKLRNAWNSRMLRFRTNGLDYGNWVSSSWYKETDKKASKFILNSSPLAIEILKEAEKYSSKDKMALIKVSLLVAHLEKGIKPSN